MCGHVEFLCCSSRRSNSRGGGKAGIEDLGNKVEASTDDTHPHIKEDKVCAVLTFMSLEL